ncbi:hypothetical protein HanIR_Chr02g0084051 [Helianthus annuus]|nr:hypothetical protein HanIR_Chr02g0084051 [Helianthus annuus]
METTLESYAHLHNLEGEDVKQYAISRARYNSVTKLYELPKHLFSNGELTGTLHDMYDKEIEKKKDGTYDKHGNDVVIEVIGKGYQHGGRLGATITLHFKKKKKEVKKISIVLLRRLKRARLFDYQKSRRDLRDGSTSSEVIVFNRGFSV